MTRKLTIVVVVVGLMLAVAAGLAVAGGRGEERPLTGITLERARDAALAHTGGGTVVETETGDDGAAYGIEVRRPSGQVVEVSLDETFTVVGSETDDDQAGESDDKEPDGKE